MTAPRLAQVIELSAYLPTEPIATITQLPAVGGGSTCRRVTHRLLHSPAADDLQAHGWLVGLLLIVVVLWAVVAL